MSTRPDYYTVLSLPPPPAPLTQQLLKKAYHAALLKHHPDKQQQGAAAPSVDVDVLTAAYKTLASAELRREYNASYISSGEGGGGGGEGGSEVVQTVDLDEFVFREEAEGGRYTKACRCGEEEGFVIREEELEAAVGEGEKEVVVGCVGCSLWWRVGFEVVDG
ncbi:DnaJ domain protein [Sphaerosporella brunnea]|uniref:Diphthamide biosynthesis protein 4 n=1 Tax=Sphaerosporella brunnea TaxID=1250544 RepID=A0A5J5ESQ4_9PEZI|nr:DnaJ domain protein [Sphaerosporella brunnea]